MADGERQAAGGDLRQTGTAPGGDGAAGDGKFGGDPFGVGKRSVALGSQTFAIGFSGASTSTDNEAKRMRWNDRLSGMGGVLGGARSK